MGSDFEVIVQLTESELPHGQKRHALREFAHNNNWRPSEEIEDYPKTNAIANAHLVVEHGLSNAAVISFLKSGTPFSHLPVVDQLTLLSISYNNLVDWHFFPDRNGLTIVYNRTNPVSPKYVSIQEYADAWRAEAFDRITGKRPNANLKSLDDALIDTLSFWKRVLSAEGDKRPRTDEISTLFNSILFVRALEDHKRIVNPNNRKILYENWVKNTSIKTIGACIKSSISELSSKFPPKNIINLSHLETFDSFDRDTIMQMILDFYKNKFAPYSYDFSLMSKHALSRIYEQYVSLLRESKSKQQTFFPVLPKEVTNRDLGCFYTPQYIAKFFSRFLKENLSPKTFRSMKVIDPACGSGIFLRTILEMQCDPRQDIAIGEVTKLAFSNSQGVDVDANACEATKLSLALLYLVLTGEFPDKINVTNAEVIQHFSRNIDFQKAFDVVVANPPFIKWDALSQDWRSEIVEFIRSKVKGKLDMYLAHLMIGLEMVKISGHLLFVLPHTFLVAENAKPLRELISKEFFVRYLVDLSDIEVFKDLGAYVVLLVLQRKADIFEDAPRATIVRCNGFIGRALQDSLDGKRYNNQFSSIYETEQEAFKMEPWIILSPHENDLRRKLDGFQTLDSFLEVRQGFVSGADPVFIRPYGEVSKDEMRIYLPYLPDRDMKRFSTPRRTAKVVFYPYLDGEKINEKELKEKFPKTFKYLESNAKALKSRKPVIAGRCPWWSPDQSRPPEKMVRAKIVSPHLVLLPTFSLDEAGKYAVSHGPLLFPIEDSNEKEFLYFFLGVLNSSVAFWQLSKLAHKYSRGYLMLEVKTLRKLRVPNPANVQPSTMKQIRSLVLSQVNGSTEGNKFVELDDVISSIYGVSEDEKRDIGMGINP